MLKKLIGTMAIAASLLFAASANASTVVYEKNSLMTSYRFETASFQVPVAGTYRAILADFNTPNPFGHIGLAVTNGQEVLGKIIGPGSFLFEAAPGNNYYASFAGLAGRPSRISAYGVHIALVPEMETWAMMALGLGLVGYVARRRTRADVKNADACAA